MSMNCTYRAATCEGSADSNRRTEDNNSCDGGGSATTAAANASIKFARSFFFNKKTVSYACCVHDKSQSLSLKFG